MSPVVSDIIQAYRDLGQAQAQGSLAQGRIWGGALQSIGEMAGKLPQEIEQQKTAALQRTALQQEVDARTAAAQGQARAQSVIAKLPRNPDLTFDTGTMAQQFAQNQVPLDQAEKFITSADNMNKFIRQANQDKADRLADVSDYVLTEHAKQPDQPITPDSIHLAFAALKPVPSMGLTDADEQGLVSALGSGAEPEQVLKNIRSQGSRFRAAAAKAEEPYTLKDDETRFQGSTIIAKGAGKTPTTAFDAALASVAKDPAHPTPDEVVRATAMAEGAKPKDEWQTFKDSYPKQVLKRPDATWDQLTPEQQQAGNSVFTQSKADPTMRGLQEQSLELGNALKRMQEGQQPSKDDAALFAKQIVEHRMAPSQVQLFGGFGTAGAAFKRMVGTEALKLDPNFNWEQAESDYQFGKSQGFQSTVRYMDEVQQSIPRLITAADQLGNTNVRFVNGLANLTKDQLNNPTLKTFQTDALAVADGIAKVLQGGGTGSGTTDTKLSQAQTLIRTSDSPAAVKAAMQEVNELFKVRRGALTRGTYLEGTAPGGAPSSSGPAIGTEGTVNGKAAVWRNGSQGLGWYAK